MESPPGFTGTPMDLLMASSHRIMTSPNDRIYAIMQVLDLQLGKSSQTPGSASREFSLDELQVQLATSVVDNLGSIPSSVRFIFRARVIYVDYVDDQLLNNPVILHLGRLFPSARTTAGSKTESELAFRNFSVGLMLMNRDTCDYKEKRYVRVPRLM